MGRDDHEGVADRGRPAREARAAAARNKRATVAGGDPDGGSHVGSGRREAHGGGGTPVDTGVTLVERELERLRTCLPRSQRSLEVGHERVDVTCAFDMRSLPTRGGYSRRHERAPNEIGPDPGMGDLRGSQG